MRTTLDIEEDVLAAIKELARVQNESAGRVLSRLAREALAGSQNLKSLESEKKVSVAGFRPFAARGFVVGNDQVNALRDREGV
ncbi:MAG TPA: hypothetical protein ENN39_09755 [Desulfonatronum sp.]|nr:hypothetical protein [Desulfonatronum sp.]